jgi:hypothetical protein
LGSSWLSWPGSASSWIIGSSVSVSWAWVIASAPYP